MKLEGAVTQQTMRTSRSLSVMDSHLPAHASHPPQWGLTPWESGIDSSRPQEKNKKTAQNPYSQLPRKTTTSIVLCTPLNCSSQGEGYTSMTTVNLQGL